MIFGNAKIILLTMVLVLSMPIFGAQQTEGTQQIVVTCDHLAAAPNDPGSSSNGVKFEDIDAMSAIEACRHAVQLHNIPRLQYQYGRSLHKGEQYSQALIWYRLATKQGHAGAQVGLGILYQNGQGVLRDLAEARQWHLKAADQGNAVAQRYLGIYYENALGVPKNMTKAAKWYRKAAEQGDRLAQSRLGAQYHNGDGVPQDFAEAAKWHLRAAQQGDAKAQRNLGLLYAYGKGVPQDFTETRRWYLLAATQGEINAQRDLGVLYYNGQGGKQDFAKARHWYLQAAQGGAIEAQNNLGAMYQYGLGGPKDYTEAMKWYRSAQLHGSIEAHTNVGLMLHYGIGKSVGTGINFFETAARGGNRLAQLYFGLALLDGRGVRQDWRKGRLWLAEAQKSSDKQISAAATKGLSKEQPRPMTDAEMEEAAGAIMALFGLGILATAFGNQNAPAEIWQPDPFDWKID